MSLGSRRIVCDQLDDARELLDFEHRMAHPQLVERAPGRIDQLTARRGTTAQRIQYTLAACRRRLHDR